MGHWLAQSWMYGGLTWFDMMDSNHGDLRNMGMGVGTNSGWGGGIRPGGYGNIEFDGSNDRVQFATNQGLAITGDVTIAAWVNMATQSASVAYVSSDSGGSAREFRLGASIRIVRFGWNANNSIVTSDFLLTSNQWTHVVARRTGSPGAWVANIYINGILNTTTATSTDPTSGGSFCIGAQSTGGNPHNGSLDDIRVYNRALGDQEIFALYQEHLYGSLTILRPARRVFAMGLGGPILRGTPSRALYQTTRAILSTLVDAMPSRALTRTTQQTLTYTAIPSPSRAPYRTAIPVVSRIVSTQPSRGLFRTVASIITNQIETMPARALYRTQLANIVQYPDPRVRIATSVMMRIERTSPTITMAL
jgi:hypothetical protein